MSVTGIPRSASDSCEEQVSSKRYGSCLMPERVSKGLLGVPVPAGPNGGCMIRQLSRHIVNSTILLATLLPLLSGCASIVGSLADSIACHHKCPGGSPEDEKKCLEHCMREREARRDHERSLEEVRQDREWRQKVNKQMKAVTKGYRGPLD